MTNPDTLAGGVKLEALLRDMLAMCERYADFIRTVKYEDIETHPYLPELEQVIEDGRLVLAATNPNGLSDAEYWRLRHRGPAIDDLLAALPATGGEPEPVAFIPQADLDRLARTGLSDCRLYREATGSRFVIPLFASPPKPSEAMVEENKK